MLPVPPIIINSYYEFIAALKLILLPGPIVRYNPFEVFMGMKEPMNLSTGAGVFPFPGRETTPSVIIFNVLVLVLDKI